MNNPIRTIFLLIYLLACTEIAFAGLFGQSNSSSCEYYMEHIRANPKNSFDDFVTSQAGRSFNQLCRGISETDDAKCINFCKNEKIRLENRDNAEREADQRLIKSREEEAMRDYKASHAKEIEEQIVRKATEAQENNIKLEAAEKRQKEEAATELFRQNRINDLKNKKIKPGNVYEASIYYNAESGDSIIKNPKIYPDRGVYSADGTIEFLEGENIFVAKAHFFDGTQSFFRVEMTREAISWIRTNGRIGGRFGIIGTYLSNHEYITALGHKKIMPVFKVSWIGPI